MTTHSLTHSPSHTHSLVHLPTHPLIHSLTHPLPPSLPHLLTHSLIHSLPPSLPPSLTHSLTHSSTPSLPPSLTHSLTHSHTQLECCGINNYTDWADDPNVILYPASCCSNDPPVNETSDQPPCALDQVYEEVGLLLYIHTNFYSIYICTLVHVYLVLRAIHILRVCSVHWGLTQGKRWGYFPPPPFPYTCPKVHTQSMYVWPARLNSTYNLALALPPSGAMILLVNFCDNYPI